MNYKVYETYYVNSKVIERIENLIARIKHEVGDLEMQIIGDVRATKITEYLKQFEYLEGLKDNLLNLQNQQTEVIDYILELQDKFPLINKVIIEPEELQKDIDIKMRELGAPVPEIQQRTKMIALAIIVNSREGRIWIEAA